MMNLKKIQNLLKNRKKVFSLSLISALIILYLGYRYYQKYKKKRRKYYYDRWFFSPELPKLDNSSLKLPIFLSNVRYKLLLSFSLQKLYGGTLKISFFLCHGFAKSFNSGFSLHFHGQSISDIEINGKIVENILFEKHQIFVPKSLLISDSQNSISLKFMNIYTQENEGIWKFFDKKDKNHQIFSVFSSSAQKIFPCFANIDLKFRIKLFLLVPRLEWESVSDFMLKKRLLADSEEAFKVLEKRKALDLFFEMPVKGFILNIYEETHSIPSYLLNFALGSFVSKEFQLVNGISVRFFYREKYRENVGFLKENLLFIEKSLEFYEAFFGRKYPLSKIEQVFVDFKFGKSFKASFMYFDEEILKETMNETRKMFWLFDFLKKICEIFCRTQCRVTEISQFSYLEEFEQFIAKKCLFFLVPEAVIYRENLVKITEIQKRMLFIHEILGKKLFKETVRSFFSRTAIFHLNQQEFRYCLTQIIKENKIATNLEAFNCEKWKENKRNYKEISLEKEENSAYIQRLKVISYDKNLKIEENSCLDSINVYFLYFDEKNSRISYKNQEFSILSHQNPYFIDISDKKIEVPCAFFGFSTGFFYVSIEEKSIHFFETHYSLIFDYKFKSLAFLSLEQSTHWKNHYSNEPFFKFCLKLIQIEKSPLIFNKVLTTFRKILEKTLSFSKKILYYNMIFTQILKRIEQETLKKDIFHKRILLETFEKLLDFLYSKENLLLALSWITENRIFFESNSSENLKSFEIPDKTITCEDFWKIMKKFFLCSEFSQEFKQESLNDFLTNKKTRGFINDLQKLTCESLVPTLENKEKIWKKTIMGEWKNFDVFQAVSLNFYEGLEREILMEFAKKFFESAEVVIITFPKEYAEIFLKNFKVHESIRGEFVQEYEELEKRIESEGGLKRLLQKEIMEIKKEREVF